MTTLTCPHLPLSLHPHAPHCRAPRPLHEPCCWSFITATAMLPCPSQLHAPPHLALRGRMHHVAMLLVPAYPLLVCFLFFFFTLTSFFATQSPRSHRRWMHSHPPPPGPTTAQLPTTM